MSDTTTAPAAKIQPQWKCTKEPADMVDSLPSRVGWTSPNYKEELEPQMTAKWRTKCADGHVGFEGTATPATDFQPLDDLAKPDIGDVTIEYLENGKWTEL